MPAMTYYVGPYGRQREVQVSEVYQNFRSRKVCRHVPSFLNLFSRLQTPYFTSKISSCLNYVRDMYR